MSRPLSNLRRMPRTGAGFVQAFTAGFFWCKICESRSQATDETEGSPWPICARCGARSSLQWHPPVLQGSNFNLSG